MTKASTTVAICIAALVCAARASKSWANENGLPPQTLLNHREEQIPRSASNDGVKPGNKFATPQRGSTNSPASQTTSIIGAGTVVTKSRTGGAAISRQRQEFLKKYDRNGDGKLDSSELAAFRSALFEKQKKAPAPSVVPPTMRRK